MAGGLLDQNLTSCAFGYYEHNRAQMELRLKRIALQVLGWMFLLLGIAGLFLPVLQGILFLLIGLVILSRQYEWARNWMERLRRRYPLAYTKAEHWLSRLGISLRPPTREREQAGQARPLSRREKLLLTALLLALTFGLVTVGRLAYVHGSRFLGRLANTYKVVAVKQESAGYRVELRRKWVIRDRRYVVRCHICGPLEVGRSYRFEPVTGRNPPMLKRAADPGEVSDFYTVVEGRLTR